MVWVTTPADIFFSTFILAVIEGVIESVPYSLSISAALTFSILTSFSFVSSIGSAIFALVPLSVNIGYEGGLVSTASSESLPPVTLRPRFLGGLLLTTLALGLS